MTSLHLLPPPAAPQKGFDVFNALDLMENKTFLEKLKFGIGDGNLQYYLYNWKCPSMGAEKVGERPAPQARSWCGKDRAPGRGPESAWALASWHLAPYKVPSLWWPDEQGQCCPFSGQCEGGRGVGSRPPEPCRPSCPRLAGRFRVRGLKTSPCWAAGPPPALPPPAPEGAQGRGCGQQLQHNCPLEGGLVTTAALRREGVASV